ncbi:hypothetical protein GCM10028819_10260 [Spirosoma humi]
MDSPVFNRSRSNSRDSSSRSRSPSPDSNKRLSFGAHDPSQRQLAESLQKRFGQIKTEAGKQKHHPVYKNSKEEIVDIDSWAMDKGSFLFFKNFGNDHKADEIHLLLEESVKNWNCKGSIIEDVMPILDAYLSGLEELSPSDIQLIDYLSALQSNIKDLRVNDLDEQCTTQLELTSGKTLKGVKEFKVALTLDWKIILEESRKQMQMHVNGKIANPPDKDVVTKIVDAAIKKIASTDEAKRDLATVDQHKKVPPQKIQEHKLYKTNTTTEEGLRRLYAFGFLAEPGKHDKTEALNFGLGKKATDKFFLTNTTPKFEETKATGEKEMKQPNFEFSKNHIRFIIFLEWKAISELLNLTTIFK